MWRWGWATLAVFVFFIFDIVINVKLLKWGYALSVRFVLDLIATLVMLFFVLDFIDLMSSLFGQGFLQIVTQGSAARASRAARAGSRAARTVKSIAVITRAGIDFVKEHAAQYPMLSKVFGLQDDATIAAQAHMKRSGTARRGGVQQAAVALVEERRRTRLRRRTSRPRRRGTPRRRSRRRHSATTRRLARCRPGRALEATKTKWTSLRRLKAEADAAQAMASTSSSMEPSVRFEDEPSS